jgi:hypothetical protein
LRAISSHKVAQIPTGDLIARNEKIFLQIQEEKHEDNIVDIENKTELFSRVIVREMLINWRRTAHLAFIVHVG